MGGGERGGGLLGQKEGGSKAVAGVFSFKVDVICSLLPLEGLTGAGGEVGGTGGSILTENNTS